MQSKKIYCESENSIAPLERRLAQSVTVFFQVGDRHHLQRVVWTIAEKMNSPCVFGGMCSSIAWQIGYIL